MSGNSLRHTGRVAGSNLQQPVDARRLRAKLTEWLRGSLTDSGAKGFVFGMSGGVDSNVTALLAKEAAGDSHLGLILPIYNDPRDRADAERVSREFKLNCHAVDLSWMYRDMLALMPPGDEVAKTNLKSRLRMSVLYYYANVYSYLVVGTINKAEFTLGYFAKYGSYGDILPLTDLLKCHIRDLAIELGMPQDLALKPASGCVSPVATAAEEWGISEDEVDDIISGQSPQSPQYEALSEEVRRKSSVAAHKRTFPPIFMLKDHCSVLSGNGER